LVGWGKVLSQTQTGRSDIRTVKTKSGNVRADYILLKKESLQGSNVATRKKRFKTIDEYIDTFPKNVQSILQELRQVIKDAAPEAERQLAIKFLLSS
jgi:hypothetical protein